MRQVTGYTHQFKAYRHEDRFVINPGSATGAYSPHNEAAVPSFVLMDIDGGKVCLVTQAAACHGVHAA
jgi:vacuolar protein sorting-associated protein 29